MNPIKTTLTSKHKANGKKRKMQRDETTSSSKEEVENVNLNKA